MAVAKKISEFGVCAFPLVTVLGRFPLKPVKESELKRFEKTVGRNREDASQVY